MITFLISISYNSFNIWYQIEDKSICEFTYKDESTIPLYFYTSNSEFLFGSSAIAYRKIDKNNFYENYFQQLKITENSFSLYGQQKPIRYLLGYSIEQCLLNIIKTTGEPKIKIEDLKDCANLIFTFHSNIDENSQLLIFNLFEEFKYLNLYRCNYFKYLNKYLSQLYNFNQPRVFIEIFGNDISVSFFHPPYNYLVKTTVLSGFGKDPRVDILARMIIEDIRDTNSYLQIDEQKEIEFIKENCLNFLDTTSLIISNKILLSNNQYFDFKVRVKHIDERFLFNRDIEDKLVPSFFKFIKENGINEKECQVYISGGISNLTYLRSVFAKYINNLLTINTSDTSRIVFESILKDKKNIFIRENPDSTLVKKNAAPPPLPTNQIKSHVDSRVTAPPPLPKNIIQKKEFLSNPVSPMPPPIPSKHKS